MKIEDNSIHIGNSNNINNSVIGNSNNVKNKTDDASKEKTWSKVIWCIIVPIIVTVVATAICVWLGIQK